MLRVNLDALSIERNKYIFQGSVFSGVVFALKKCVVNQVIECRQGVFIGKYKNEFLSTETNQLRIDYSCLEQEEVDADEPFFYQGKRFSGLAYEFEGDFCTTEFLFDNGWISSQVSYWASGDIESIDINEDDFAQYIEFYRSGKVKDIDLFERDSFIAKFSFDETERITCLIIDGEYFKRGNALKSKLKFPVVDNKLFAEDLCAGDYLYISGKSVDDDIFKRLASNHGLAITSKLRVCKTALTGESLGQLIRCTNIKQLYLESDIITTVDVKKFKMQRPDCYVELNRDDVII